MYGAFLIIVGLLGFAESVFFVEGLQPFTSFACGSLIGVGIYWIGAKPVGTRP